MSSWRLDRHTVEPQQRSASATVMAHGRAATAIALAGHGGDWHSAGHDHFPARCCPLMKPLLAFLFTFITACLLPAGAAPGSPATVEWQHLGSHSYEAEHPGLGVSHRYRSAIGWADVYVYDLQRKGWRDGVDDGQFAAHFGSTVDEVRHYGKTGMYAGLEIGPVRDVAVEGQAFRTISFRFVRDGRAMLSATYLTGRGGQLLKYRISVDASVGHELDGIAQRFVADHLRGMPAQER